MINSISKELYEVQIPSYNGEVKMLPFDLSNINNVPEQFKELVSKMIEFLPIKKGIAYLTIDGKFVESGKTQRRGGPHTDGNYLKENSWGGTSGWKVGGDGIGLTTEEHKLSYESNTGGMIICSDYPGCMGWNGKFDGFPNTGGDCSHLDLDEGFLLKPNTVYYGNSQWIHESLPLNESVHRNLVRITLPTDYTFVY